MTYSYSDIQEILLKAQCCYPVLVYNIILAGKTANDCMTTLIRDAQMLNNYREALKNYRPEGYEFTVNDVVIYTQTEEDACLSEEDVQWLVEGIRSVCQCSSCLDTEELLNDI